MKLCRFKSAEGEVRVGLAVDESTIADLSGSGVESITSLLEDNNGTQKIRELAELDLPQVALGDVTLLTPVEDQEVWAAGVTYLRSKKARMEESDFSANAYDLVYDAARPEIFFKSLPSKVVGPGEAVGIREDSKWNVPEPELTLVVNSRKELVGYTIGNDMSSRDIEGENLLYLPQAKVYDRSCAVGPWLVMGANEGEVREWTIGVQIEQILPLNISRAHVVADGVAHKFLARVHHERQLRFRNIPLRVLANAHGLSRANNFVR